MSQFVKGDDALDIIEDSNEGGIGNDNEFTSLKSGESIIVKLLGTRDFVAYYVYGSFKPKVNTFAAKNPSKKSKKGYPVEDLTPWDLAWKYHADKSEEYRDKHSTEAYKYRPKKRVFFGFYDLDNGKCIVVDFTANQANAIIDTIKNNEKRIDKMAFQLTKQGSSTSTTASLIPLPFIEDDLTEKQLENFNNAPDKFDDSKYEGLVYEADEDEQLLALDTMGFDVKLIGKELPERKDEENTEGIGSGEDGKLIDDDLPF